MLVTKKICSSLVNRPNDFCNFTVHACCFYYELFKMQTPDMMWFYLLIIQVHVNVSQTNDLMSVNTH
jgi:hypothetical protein